jgi:hypothetical protein
MSLLSQLVTPKDNEALLPMSPLPVPKFKEALLTPSTKENEASPLPMLYPICACSYSMRYSMQMEGSSTRMAH